MRHLILLMAWVVVAAGCDGLGKSVQPRDAGRGDAAARDAESDESSDDPDTELSEDGRDDDDGSLSDVTADTAADTVPDTGVDVPDSAVEGDADTATDADDAADITDAADTADTSSSGLNGCGGTDGLIYRSRPAAPGEPCGLCGDGTLVCSGTAALSCTGASTPNACGGCGALEGAIGTACGLCNDGVWACGAGRAECLGDSSGNGCGGCGLLDLAPGVECAQAGGETGLVVCSGREASVCTAAESNACGGVGPLALPAGVSGVEPVPGLRYGSACRTGVLACEGTELIAVAVGGENGCGGCEPLLGVPGTACGPCGGVWTCDTAGGVACVGGSLNACGGCGDLAEPPGGLCDAGGNPGALICISADETACVAPGSTNACGGLGTLSGAPLGSACGSCGDGVVVCDAADLRRRSTVCETVDSIANSCGGCGPLDGTPGTPCGTCGLGVLACNGGSDGLACTEDPGAAALNACGGCGTLAALPGDGCGRCGSWACDPSAVGRLRCEEPAIGCAAAAVCGNGRLEVGERCDDGNAVEEACNYGDLSCEVCDASCALVAGATAFCGDGLRNGGEVCDDGNFATEACLYGEASCTVCDAGCLLTAGATASCGDGRISDGEACDDGNTETEPCGYGERACEVCDAACALVSGVTAYCGDGAQNGAEGCDDGNSVTEACSYGETACTVCDAGCAFVAGATAFCGDGITTSGESCDDGNAETEPCAYGATDCVVCNATCSWVAGETAFCGDGVKNGFELCDPVVQPDTCDGTCACLPGTHAEASGCLPDTRLCDVPFGTGTQSWSGSWGPCVVDRCESGFSLLRGACIAVGCGNEVVELGEACDDGNLIAEACQYGQTACLVCDGNCQLTAGETAFCGDGLLDGREGCDDGNTLTESCSYASGACLVCGAACTLVDAPGRRCGDGITDAEEECDDGNLVETDSCFSDCTSPRLDPPTGVSATDGTYTDFVMVSWSAVPGAAGYHVYRDGIRITGTPTTFTTYPDVGAEAPTPFGPPTNVRATTTDSTKVRVTWTAPTTAPGTVHQYAVSTVGVVEGTPSAPDAGNRGEYTLVGYQISIDGGAWTDLPISSTFDDSAAPPPSLSIGSGVLRAGSATTVSMSCPGATTSNGANRSYSLKTRYSGGPSYASASVTGYRPIPAGTPSYQWYLYTGVAFSGCTSTSCSWYCGSGCSLYTSAYMTASLGAYSTVCSAPR